MSTELQVVPLSRSSRDIKRFLRQAYAVYRNDPFWVAPLLMDLRKVFEEGNPFFAHAEMQLWVACRDGRDVGRIAGVIDRNYNEFQGEAAAFYGFFECIDDVTVSGRLFETVFGWAEAKGMRKVLGPISPSTNDECGLLVEGFDSSPLIMMTYNPRYYLDLVAAAGLTKAKDLIAYDIDLAICPMDRLGRIAAKVRKRHPELQFRPIRRRTLDADIAKVKEVYNAAWERNWGFVPMTDAEVDFMAARLKPLLMEGIVWLAENETQPVGFLLALPDYNLPLRPLRGQVWTPRVLGFVPYLMGWKSPAQVRVLTLGVTEHYRNKGLESVMLHEGLQAGAKVGFRRAEASWILEDNVMMRRLMEVFGAQPYKTYRIYERDLARGGVSPAPPRTP